MKLHFKLQGYNYEICFTQYRSAQAITGFCNTWKECAIVALDTSIKYLEAMNTDTVNKFKLSTQYTCKQNKEI